MDASDLHGSVGGAQWTNVQDPVKQMITAITKAVRTQSAGIKDLDRRLGDAATVELLDQRLEATMRAVADQVEGQLLQLGESLKRKAAITDLSSLEKNTISMAKQLDKINELLHSQNHAILNLNDRVTRVTADVETLKEPNLDRLYQYVDRQTKELSLEIDRKLAAKADQARAAESASTLRHVSEEVVPSLLGQVAELKADMRDVVSRSDLQLLANAKANIADLNDLAADVSERPTRGDTHQIINAQIKPLVSAITAMEKAIHVQEISIQNSRLEMQKPYATAPPPPRPSSPSRSLTRQQVGEIVEEAFRERAAQQTFVTTTSLEGSLSSSREALLSEVYSRQEALKEELVAGQRELMGSMRRHTDARLQEIAATAREARELNNKAKGAVKDLASNVAKALAKKVDKVDLKRALKENSAGNKGGSSLAARDDGPGEFTPCLLNKSHSQWAHSAGQGGPLSKSHLSAAEAIAPVNGESLKNEEELKKQLELIQDHLFGLKAEMNALQRTVRTQGPDRSRGGGMQSGAGVLKHSSGGSSPPGSDQSVGGAAVSDREWKAALSDLSRNLRREMSDKVEREEMQSTVRAELDLLEARIQTTKKELNSRATLDDLGRVEAETTLLRSQVTGELTGARWLWRTGKLLKEGWIPWDTEVSNAMPNALVWRPSSPVVLTRPAGLYKICVAIFTSLPSVVQVCLNGEPILTLQPDSFSHGALEDGAAANPIRDDRYILRRNRHSDGEVSCLSIDEHVSLPANSKIAIRFNSQAAAQAFFSIKKL